MKTPSSKGSESSASKPSWMGDYSVGQVSSFLQSESKKSSSTNPALAGMFGKARKPIQKKAQKHTLEHHGGSGDVKQKGQKNKQQHLEGKVSSHSSSSRKKNGFMSKQPAHSSPTVSYETSQTKHIHFGDGNGKSSNPEGHKNKKAGHMKKKHANESKPVQIDGKSTERKKYKVKRNRKNGKGKEGSESASNETASVSRNTKTVQGPQQSGPSQKTNRKRNENKQTKGSSESKTDKAVPADTKNITHVATNLDVKLSKNRKKKMKRKLRKKLLSGNKADTSVSVKVEKESDAKTSSTDSKKKSKRKRKLNRKQEAVNGEAQSNQPPGAKKAKMSSDKPGQEAKKKRKNRHKKKPQQQKVLQDAQLENAKKEVGGKDEKPNTDTKQVKQGKKRRRSHSKQKGDIAKTDERKEPSPSKRKQVPDAHFDDGSDEDDSVDQSPKKAKRTDKTEPKIQPSMVKTGPHTPKKANMMKRGKGVKQHVVESGGSESESDGESESDSESDESDIGDSTFATSDEKGRNSFRKNLLMSGNSKQVALKYHDSDSSSSEESSGETNDDLKTQAIRKALLASKNLKAMELEEKEENDGESTGSGSGSGSECTSSNDDDDDDDEDSNQVTKLKSEGVKQSKQIKESVQHDDSEEESSDEQEESSDEQDDQLDDSSSLANKVEHVVLESKLKKIQKSVRKDDSDDDDSNDDESDDDVQKNENDDISGDIDEILKEHDVIELPTPNQMTTKNGSSKASDLDEEEKEQKTTSQTKNDPEILQKTIFVGNLTTSTSKAEVILLFKKFGKIVSVRFRSGARADPKLPQKVAMITKDLHPERSSYNAYVVFKKAEAAQKALSMNGYVHGHHHIRVDMAEGNKKHDTKHSIFVGNLPFDIETEPLTRHFMQCGEVMNTRLIRDATTGLGKGFGYVLFQESSSVELALKLDGSLLSGRNIRVNRALSKEKVQKIQQKKTSRTSQKGGPSKPKEGQQEKRRWLDPKVLKKRQKRQRFKKKTKARGKL